MDAAFAAGLGFFAGAAAGFIPGFHAAPALMLASSWTSSRPGAAAATAFVVSNLFFMQLTTVYLGLPSADLPLAALPSQRMAQQGRGPEALRTAIDGTLAGLVLAIVAALPLKWIAGEPGRWAEAPDWLLVAAATAIAVWVPWRERRNGVWAIARSGFLVLLSAAFALVVLGMPWPPAWGHHADARLPLMSGLFAVPALLALRAPGNPLPEQERAVRRLPWGARGACAAATLIGTCAGAWSGLIPGVTAGLAATATHRRHEDARPAIGGMAAAMAARQIFALTLLWVVGSARSTLAVAIRPNVLVPWTAGRAPDLLILLFEVAVVAALAAYLLLRLCDRAVVSPLRRFSGAPLAAGGAILLFVGVLALAGPLGILVLLGASAVGLLPGTFRVSRLALSGALLAPPLLHLIAP